MPAATLTIRPLKKKYGHNNLLGAMVLSMASVYFSFNFLKQQASNIEFKVQAKQFILKNEIVFK